MKVRIPIALAALCGLLWTGLAGPAAGHDFREVRELDRLAALAYSVEGGGQDFQSILALRALLALQDRGGALYYPNGRLARLGGSLYYDNGVLARMGSSWYYPNGRVASLGSAWYYPNGVLLNLGGRGPRGGPVLVPILPVAAPEPAPLPPRASPEPPARKPMPEATLDSFVEGLALVPYGEPRVKAVADLAAEFEVAPRDLPRLLPPLGEDRYRLRALEHLAPALQGPVPETMLSALFRYESGAREAREVLRANR